MIIEHNQVNDPDIISFAQLKVTMEGNTVLIRGPLTAKGQSFEADFSVDVVAGQKLTIFVQNNGTVSTDETGPYAHLAWWDGTNLNYIKHEV